jgi:hypothetical protein
LFKERWNLVRFLLRIAADLIGIRQGPANINP